MTSDIESGYTYGTLSLKDVLEAREAYHPHLMNKPNVVATAVGRYRIRNAEAWPQVDPDRNQLDFSGVERCHGERTLANSQVRFYSWPAVLVFVSGWIERGQFGMGEAQRHPDQMVPRTLYLPDGRRVPVCVISARKDQHRQQPVKPYRFTPALLGGGYSVVATDQHQEHFGSIACLVTDGCHVYALTNRHVTREPGTRLESEIDGERMHIGTTADKQLTAVEFETIYPKLQGSGTLINLDAALIDVLDLRQWTAQVYGIGELGRPVDLSDDNLSLQLLGQPVRAYGCASGELHGQIDALFYRYRSMGGLEYAADFLIGPRPGQTLDTRPGDSGTLWVLENEPAQDDAPEPRPEERNRPIALQWGGQVLGGQAEPTRAYALATCLSTVCQQLGVDVVRSWNIGYPEYWGLQPHLSIAGMAVSALREAKLQDLLVECMPFIAGTPDGIEKANQNKIRQMCKDGALLPLSISPDGPWSWYLAAYDSNEGPNHYINIDTRGDDFARDLFQRPTLDAWWPSFDASREGIGRLPFRVLQVHSMLAEADSRTKFVFLAGVLAHYVADCCQPLHLTQYYRGPLEKPDKEFHSKIDSIVKDQMWAEVSTAVTKRIETMAAEPAHAGAVGSAKEVFAAIVGLMGRTYDAMSPVDLVKCYGDVRRNRALKVWETYHGRIIEALADGCCTLAQLWAGAWQRSPAKAKADKVTKQGLDKFYRQQDYLASPTAATFGREP